MLNKFMVWSESKMRAKGEEWSANHMLELIALVEGLSQVHAMSRLHGESQRLKMLMAAEQNSVEHGALWSMRENIEQALRGGNGELWFADHVPNKG